MMAALTVYGEWQNAVFTFLSQYLEKSKTSMVFDVFAGMGLNHVSLGNITSTQIFSIESDAELYHLLFRNSQLNGVLKRALVAQLDPSLPYVDLTELRSGHRGMYRNVFDLYRMTSQCPTVVKLSELFNESTSEVTTIKTISSLVQSLWLLKYCQPLYYIAGSASSYPLIRILSSLPHYRVFWHVTTTISMSTPHRQRDNQPVLSLVAIPSSMMHDPPQGMLCDENICDEILIPVEARKYFIQDYNLNLHYKSNGLSNSINDTTTRDHARIMTGRIAQDFFASEQTCDQSDHNITMFTVPILHHQSIAGTQLSSSCDETNMVSLYVYLEAIMSPFHPLMDEEDGLLSEPSSITPAMTFQECLVPSVELYIEAIVEAQCILWLSTLQLRFHDSIRVNDSKHARYVDRYTESEMLDAQSAPHNNNNNDNNDKDNTMHIHALVTACTAFAVKQWHMVYHMAMYRATSPVPILAHLEDVIKNSSSNNNNNNSSSSSNSNNSSSNSSSSSSNNTTSNAIETEKGLLPNDANNHRPPFSLLPQPDACGEPLWCTHTIELQRRLTAWQNPNRHDQIVSGERGGGGIVNTTPHEGNSLLDPSVSPTVDPTSLPSRSSKQKRTCQNAKYLLFQPRSDQNGIGDIPYPKLTLNYPNLIYLTPT